MKDYYNVSDGSVTFPFSSAVGAGDYVFVSGQPSMDVNTGVFIDGSFETQFNNCFKNLGMVLASAGLTFDDVVKVTVFLNDMRSYDEMNQLYIKKFGSQMPARSCFACAGLPLGAKVEIEMIAYRGKR